MSEPGQGPVEFGADRIAVANLVKVARFKARTIINNVEYVIAVELLCGVQALDLLTRGRPGPGTQSAYAAVRDVVPFLDRDRTLARDIEKVAELIRSGDLVHRVEDAVGELE